jgi:uncharacterized protein (DUF2336 family)
VIVDALVERGVDQSRAVVLAGVGLMLFRAAYERWTDDAGADLAVLLGDVASEFRSEMAAPLYPAPGP